MKTHRRDEIVARLGRRVARLRLAQRPHMTQDALAARIGLTRGRVSRIETGEVDVPLSVAAALARALRVPVSRLLCDEAENREAEKWHLVALEACRAFSGLRMTPEDAAPAVRWLTSLLASYVRKRKT